VPATGKERAGGRSFGRYLEENDKMIMIIIIVPLEDTYKDNLLGERDN